MMISKDAAAAYMVLFVISAAVVAYNWRDIYGSDWFMRTFEPQKWEMTKARRAEFKRQWSDLDKRACAVMMEARRQVAPIEEERLMLFGMDRAAAEKLAWIGIKQEQEMCDKYGIPPYSTGHERDQSGQCYDRQGAYEC
jgi:hypothetical protein